MKCACVQGCTGGDWAVRLQATEVEQSAESQDAGERGPQRASLLFYIGNEEVTSSASASAASQKSMNLALPFMRRDMLTFMQVQNSITIAPKLARSKGSIIAEGGNSPVGSWALHMQGEAHQNTLGINAACKSAAAAARGG